VVALSASDTVVEKLTYLCTCSSPPRITTDCSGWNSSENNAGDRQLVVDYYSVYLETVGRHRPTRHAFPKQTAIKF
jgi:hypothetical protein